MAGIDIVTFTDARKNLASVMDRVRNGQEPVVITREKSEPVVMLSLSEYDSIMETLHLLRSPRNRERLAAAIDALDAGEGVTLPE